MNDISRPRVVTRRYPIGAEPQVIGGTHFRVWAPDHRQLSVVIEDAAGQVLGESALEPDAPGYFSVLLKDAAAGSLYRFRPGTAAARYPDPASRRQPSGPHGPSEVVNPLAFAWTDSQWPGVTIDRQVIYELHVGTFTAAGTWQGAAAQLPALRDLGITTIEMMPVAEFGGRHGWGYDGVNLFAPTHRYGTPDDLRAFIDRAHALHLAVILDVVYNHFGPDGNYLGQFARHYFSSRYANEWGDAINFDQDAEPVRELVRANAAYWIDEFHFDGLRLDATQQIFDQSPVHLVAELTAAARAAAGARSIIVVAENETQDARLLRPAAAGGHGLDAMWNDDFHHSAVVALTGRREAYYTDYAGSPQEFLSMIKWGFLYQGQRYQWQKQRRGAPSIGLEAHRFITFLENHDQVANAPAGGGQRLHQLASPSLFRAMTGLWLLSPGTPMFFQGQEWGTAAPFRFFADHGGELGAAVRRGRAEFMSQFRSAASRGLFESLPDPNDPATVAACVLDAAARAVHEPMLALHRDLLRLRRTDPFVGGDGVFVDGAVIGPDVLALRWFAADPRPSGAAAPAPGIAGSSASGRLLLVNFGVDLLLGSVREPLLAPPPGARWRLSWSSEDPRYGGQGTAEIETAEAEWSIPGHAAVFLEALPL